MQKEKLKVIKATCEKTELINENHSTDLNTIIEKDSGESGEIENCIVDNNVELDLQMKQILGNEKYLTKSWDMATSYGRAGLLLSANYLLPLLCGPPDTTQIHNTNIHHKYMT